MSDIIIKLNGGTGNQLFQITAALSLAKIYGKNCRFSSETISKNKYKRKVEISSLLKEFKVLENITKKNQNIIFFDQYDFDHPIYFSKSSPLSRLDNDIQIQGYFTNYRIHNKDILRKIKAHIRGLNTIKKLKKLSYIAIHIRELHGTDKNNINKKIDNLSIDYYSKCLKRIRQNNSFQNINNAIVFSDTWKDPKKSKLLPKLKELLKSIGIKYINGDKLIDSSLEIINIFSFSKCCIISNSTLSWWGAYLSNGEIYCPVMNLWEPDLKVPDNWNQIYSNELVPKTHHNKISFETFALKKEVYNRKVYNHKRLDLIKIVRLISKKLNKINIFIQFKKWLKSRGILPENSYTTFV